LFPERWEFEYAVHQAKPDWCPGSGLFEYCYGQV
jgi:hypothetical protein